MIEKFNMVKYKEKQMKKIFSIIALIVTSVMLSSLAAPAMAAQPLYTVAKTTTQTVVKSNTLNMRSGASTKHKVVKNLKKNNVVSKTGKKSGKWVQIKVSKTTGWVHSSYLTAKKSTSYAPAKPRVATASEQKAWTASLPAACKKVQIKEFIHVNKNKNGASFKASAKYDSKGKMYFTLSIDGNMKPTDGAAKALMKHECGHVLMDIYSKGKGKTNFQNTLSKGWASSNKMRVENAADCIADQLGAVRQTKNYKVGYGTKCSSAQKNVAKTITNYSKNR